MKMNHKSPQQGAGDVGRCAASLVDVFRQRAAEQPDRTAFTFLPADENLSPQSRTYAELDQQARAIAVQLSQHTQPGDRALLMYDAGLDYVAALAGCFYAGVVAVPVLSPDPLRVSRTLPRLEAIVRDAQARILLGTSVDLNWASAMLGTIPDLGQLVPSDQIDPSLAHQWRAPQVDRDTPAFLQYTSGSTGMPKGVLVRHGKVLANLDQMEQLLDVDDAIACTWLPAYHDMGLVGGVLQCWYSGRHNVLLSPLSFFQHPLRWLRAVSDYRATTIAAPDFAYDLCVRKIKPEDRGTLDLSSLRIALSGAEPVRAATIARFLDAFTSCGVRRDVFRPCYGMAEATLLITSSRRETGAVVRSFSMRELSQHRAVTTAPQQDGAQQLVSSGRPPENLRVLAVDPQSCRPLPEGQVGEIWAAGPNVAGEYWNQPAATTETFHAVTAEGEGPFLRTGDLGFFHQGELFISGRLKDLIIIRGRNYYPQDIEQSIEASHPSIKPFAAVAFSLEAEGREQLVLVQEVTRPNKTDLEEVARCVRRAVFDAHELSVDRVILVRGGSIPKTSSGKLQRRDCQDRYLRGELDVLFAWHAAAPPEATETSNTFVAPRNPLEARLVAAWVEILGVEQIGIFDSFFDLGGTSLLATQLINRLGPELGVTLPLTELFDRPTIAQLADLIAQQRAAQDARDAALFSYLDRLSDEEAERLLAGQQQSLPPASVYDGVLLSTGFIPAPTKGAGHSTGAAQPQ